MLDLDATFLHALYRSLAQALLAGGVSIGIGWAAGVAAGLWSFPARRLLVPLMALSLLLPSFLVAIGLSMLSRSFTGLVAATWAFACSGVPLVFFVTLAAMRAVTSGQADAARLAGGEGLLFRLALRMTRPVAVLAGVLAGVLTLADPGPGQIFGWHSAASELLVSFAARYNLALATHQALAVAVLAALCAWPFIARFADSFATGLLARDTKALRRRAEPSMTAAFAVIVLGLLICPIAGLLRPLTRHSWPIERAWNEVARSGTDTIVYAVLAAVLAVIVGFVLAAFVQSDPRLRRPAIMLALAWFALPPVLAALWLIPYSSRTAVALALALRCAPIALLFGLRAFGSIPASWKDAARVHGVSQSAFALRVMAPWVLNWALPAALLAGLVATAEIGVVLMLHPPGHGTLPLSIFTVMANAPEALVATLCLLYVATAAVLGAAVIRAWHRA